MSRFSDQAFVFAKMIGDRNRPKASFSVKIDDLSYGLVSVAESAVNMKIS